MTGEYRMQSARSMYIYDNVHFVCVSEIADYGKCSILFYILLDLQSSKTDQIDFGHTNIFNLRLCSLLPSRIEQVKLEKHGKMHYYECQVTFAGKKNDSQQHPTPESELRALLILITGPLVYKILI